MVRGEARPSAAEEGGNNMEITTPATTKVITIQKTIQSSISDSNFIIMSWRTTGLCRGQSLNSVRAFLNLLGQ